MIWLLSVEGRQGIGRDEAQYFRAGERYWGWFSELGDNLAAGHPGRSFTAVRHRSLLERQRARSPGRHEGPLRDLLARLPHAATARGRRAACTRSRSARRHVTLPLFARESTAFRFPAILFAALLVGLVYRFARALAAARAGGGGGRADARAAALLLPRADLLLRRAHHDDGLRRRLRLLEVAARLALGDRHRRAVRDLAGGEAQRLADALLSRRPLPLDAAGGSARARRLPARAARLRGHAVLGPPIFFAHWPWLWVSPVARTRAYVERHLEHEHYNFEYLGFNFNQPPTDARDEVAARHGAVRRDRRSPCR